MVDNDTKIKKINIITMLQLLVPINIIFIRISLSCDRHITVKLTYIEVYLHLYKKAPLKQFPKTYITQKVTYNTELFYLHATLCTMHIGTAGVLMHRPTV